MNFRVGQHCTYRMPGGRNYACRIVKVRPQPGDMPMYIIEMTEDGSLHGARVQVWSSSLQPRAAKRSRVRRSR